MINFAIGIFFLIIVTVLSTIYIVASGYVVILIIKSLQFFILRRRSKNKLEALRLVKEKRKSWKNRLLSRKLIYSFLTTLIVFHLTIYLNQRAKWVGDNNAHLTAKEYYVVGQVLNAFRSILTNFIHPEIPILIPATWLQKQIYNQGVKHLPKNDGEIAVWQNQWFYYHYTKQGRRALFAVNWESSPETVRLLDKW